MTRIISAIGSAILIVALTVAAKAGEPGAAEWVDKMNEALLSARTLRADAHLTTRNDRGAGRDIEFELVRWVSSDGVRTLLEVQEPQGARGLLYEIIAEEGEPLERWVYLPDVDRLLRFVGFKRSDAFLGTEFGYEDLEIIVPEERRRGSVEWVSEAGASLVKVTSHPYHVYEKIETWIDPETSLPARAHFYDRANVLWKVETYDDIVEVDGQPFPTRFEMRNVQNDTISSLELKNLEVDVPVAASYFSEREIERRIRAPESASAGK